MAEREIGVISPEGLSRGEKKNFAPRLDTLRGKTVCEVFNNHFKGDYMFEIMRQLLRERFPGVKVIPYTEFPLSFVGGDPGYHQTVSEEIAALAKAKGCDALISSNGG
jgi:hypothetical protein